MRRVAIVSAILVVAVAAGLFLWAGAQFSAPGPRARHGTQTIVLIRPGIGGAGIAQALKMAGVIRNAPLFQWEVRLKGEAAQLKAGEYAVPSGASMARVAAILIAGKSVEHKLTIPEGFTSQMAYNAVRADKVLIGRAGPVSPEGSLLPDTYLFIRGTTRAQLLARMHKAQLRFLAKVWPKRAAGLPLKTPAEAVILASIVEKETALPQERSHIAAVFENRLRLGMKLQSDPTIIYGITKGYPLGHPILQSELTAATPYNTYIIDGLPPTPICNPGRASILAVLHPLKTKDLYFVADGSGGHVFAATIAQQDKNVARWRQIEKAQTHR
ncbi:MAG: endolytic transglycosylase MltG [Alphaproteobacteria bacterium]|nr:endolytic transglycosylase MltG [Alphaproteobacteria bacterium]